MTLSLVGKDGSLTFGAVVESSARWPDPGGGWRVDDEAEAAFCAEIRRCQSGW